MGSSTSEFIYNIKAQYQGTGDIKKLGDDLRNLDTIKSFEKLSADIAKTETALESAQKKAVAMKETMEATGSKTDTAAYNKAATEVDRMTNALKNQQTKLQGYTASLKAAGISTTELAAAQQALNASTSGKGNILAAENMLGVRSFSTIKGEIQGLESAYATMAASGMKSDAELARAHESLLAKTKLLNLEMKTAPGVITAATNSMASSVTYGMKEIGAVIAGVFAIEKIGEYLNKMREVAEEEMLITARLRLMSSSEAELHHTEQQLYDTSQRTGTAFAGNADILARMGVIMVGTGTSSKELISTIDVLNQTLVVSGANTEKATSFMNAFVYAMDSGSITSKQLRTMLKDNPEFVKLLAESLGVAVEKLKGMADAGELTADRVIQATQKMATRAQKDFESMPLSTERAMTMVHNAINKVINDSNEAGKGTGKISGAITDLAKTIETNKAGIGSVFSLIVDGSTKAVNGIGNLGTAISATKALSSGKLGFVDYMTMSSKDLNEWLKKNNEEVKKQGPAHEEVANKMKTVYKPVTEEIKKQFQEMADKVKGIYDQIGSNNFDLAKSVADIRRSGMTEGDAWTSLRNEADKYAKAARTAAAAGDFAQANAIMKDAIADAKALSNEVTVNGEKMTARNAKIQELNKLNTIANQILLDQAEAEKAAAAAKDKSTGGKLSAEMPDAAKMLGTAATEAATKWNTTLDGLGAKSKDVFDAIYRQQLELPVGMTKFNDAHKAAFDLFEKEGEAAIGRVKEMLSKDLASGTSVSFYVSKDSMREIQELEEKLARIAETAKPFSDKYDAAFKSFLDTGSEDIRRLNDQLNDMAKDRTMTLHVNRVEDGQGYARGGQISGFATGGNPFFGGLSGYGGGDRRLILVEDGEHVIRKEAVAKFGHNFFQNFNRLVFPIIPSIPKFMFGGKVAATISRFANGGPVLSGGGGGVTNHHYSSTVTVNVPANASASTQSSAKEIARTVMAELERMNRRRS